MKLRSWFVARRERKEREEEEYLRQKARDDAWAADPGKAMHDAGAGIVVLIRPIW